MVCPGADWVVVVPKGASRGNEATTAGAFDALHVKLVAGTLIDARGFWSRPLPKIEFDRSGYRPCCCCEGRLAAELPVSAHSTASF